jgi:xylulokinase
MYIGIDLGTSGVKLIMVSKQGEVIASITKSYDLVIPKPMWTEQNPNDWYKQTIVGLKELIKGYEKEIKAIGFSGQMHGLVILDEYDHVLRNALLWNDQRTIKEVDYLNQNIGIDELLNETGNIALTGLTAPKLLWIKNNEPEVFARIHKIMLPKDYLAYMLSGVFATDVSDVSGTLYYDVKNKAYSKKMLDILNITEEQCPKVYESYEKIGVLKNTLKHELGINQDVDIIIGAGDQAAGAVGIGIVNDGTASVSLGTSGVVFVASDQFKVDQDSFLQSYAHANGKYHMMGVMLNAAGSLNWWSEKIFQNYNYQDFFEKLEQTKIEDSLYFLPYLSGERSPINDPEATGVFFGLRLEHRKEHMDRAVIEGVTYALKQSFELIKNLGVDIDKVKITGGGAKSTIWSQMISDIFNVEVETIKIEEGPALGAAILAMVGNKAYPSVEAACSTIIKVKDSYEPNDVFAKVYEHKYQEFIKIYPVVKKLYKSL